MLLFGTNLRRAMKARRMTSKQLAHRAGYPEETVRQWRKGRYNPRLQSVADIAEALGVTAGWLAFGEGEME